ncbi:MAG: hypothetical protein A4E72_01170 [Syntrophus sp. PtaU1.Bin208]|nr:MAG: hypothetical protein A4E72_01170 [Syntrophus sp. PtaU1.Bin208]
MLRRFLNFLWPKIKDQRSARRASHQGLIPVALLALSSIIPMFFLPRGAEQLGGLLGLLINLPVILIPGIAIYFCFRIGAILLLLLLLSMDMFTFSTVSEFLSLNIIPSHSALLMAIGLHLFIKLPLHLFAINSLRGTFALSRMKKGNMISGIHKYNHI